MKTILALAALVGLTGCSLIVDVSREGPLDEFATPPPKSVTATGRGGAAATIDVRATMAAIEILRQGGNAVDAAVAAASVLGVTDQFSCGIGGGGFMMIYLADEGRVVTLDHRETAPAAIDAALFYEDGAPIELTELVNSGLSVGTPGMARGWDEALRSHGTMTLDKVLWRAISVAERGFEVDQSFVDQTTRNLERFNRIESTRKLFLTGAGQPFPLGTVLTNPDLARTYSLIAAGGADAFYKGEIAQAIVSAVTSPPVADHAGAPVRPGVLSLEDLAGYQPIAREPLVSEYRGHTLHGMDVPSSGGLTVGMTLNLLSGYDPGAFDRADFLHRYLEASRLAFADRGVYMADPAYVDVPREGLLSLDYAHERRLLIFPFASHMPAEPGDPWAYQPGASSQQGAKDSSALDDPNRETTHISVTDAQGNIVAYTCTIESEGGNGIVVPGYGFLLNNELTDFTIPVDPAMPAANAVEPGKRPRSSMSPVILTRNGRPVLALGSPGGSTIITTVVQILVNHLDLAMPIDEAVAAPRVSQRNSPMLSSEAEPEFLSTEEAAELEELGHSFVEVPTGIGAATAIRFNDDGSVTAVAEPARRTGGHAMVVTPE